MNEFAPDVPPVEPTGAEIVGGIMRWIVDQGKVLEIQAESLKAAPDTDIASKLSRELALAAIAGRANALIDLFEFVDQLADGKID